ncbi:MAG: oligosaccharide flippase family protein [Chloroflexota bacterium]|nr:oligosaccharide flippase family protein [Chloroflexota bacterium]
MASETVSKKEGKHGPLVERAGWAVFWNAAFFPLKVLLGFASGIVVVRLLRIEGFALLTVTMSLLNGLGLFSDLGIERTLPRFYPEIEMRYGRRGVTRLLFWVAVVKGGVMLLLVGALAVAPSYWIAQFNLGPNGGWLLLFVAALLVLGAASDVSVQLLYTHFRQKATNSLDVLAAVVRPTLTATLVLLGWGVLGAMLALLITTVVSVAISLWLAWRLLRMMPEEPAANAAAVKRPSTRPIRQRLISFAGLNYLMNWTVYLYDLPFVALALSFIIRDPASRFVEVAIISLAFKATKEFLRALVVPFTGVQTPFFSRLYAEGRIEGLKTAYATMTKFLLLALLPAGVGFLVAARNILLVFYGQVGHDAVLNELTVADVVACTGILAFGLFGESMISVVLNVLMVYEEYRAVIVARLVSLVSVPLLILLVPRFGAVGAAIAVAGAALGSRSVALIYGLRRLQLPFPSRFFTRVGTASLVMGFGVVPFLLLPANYLTTGVMLALGVVLFLGVFRLLGGIAPEDKARFNSLRLPFVGVALRFL